jgi:hypothetical protein
MGAIIRKNMTASAKGMALLGFKLALGKIEGSLEGLYSGNKLLLLVRQSTVGVPSMAVNIASRL